MTISNMQNKHKMVKVRRVYPEICSQTDKHTDRQTDRHGHHNTMLPYQGQSNNCTNPNWHRMMLPQSSFQMEGSKARGAKSLTTLNTVLQYTS